MNDDERREARWIDMSILAGGFAGFVLAGIGFYVSVAAKSQVDRPDVAQVVGFALAAALPSGVIGMIGAAAQTPRLASLVGAGLVGLPLLVCNCDALTVDRIWHVIGLSASGSILCQVGAVASGTAACGADQKKKIQFTVQQFLLFFIPVAIYFGYLRTLMHK